MSTASAMEVVLEVVLGIHAASSNTSISRDDQARETRDKHVRHSEINATQIYSKGTASIEPEASSSTRLAEC